MSSIDVGTVYYIKDCFWKKISYKEGDEIKKEKKKDFVDNKQKWKQVKHGKWYTLENAKKRKYFLHGFEDKEGKFLLGSLNFVPIKGNDSKFRQYRIFRSFDYAVKP